VPQGFANFGIGTLVIASRFDPVASSFDRHRALPAEAAQEIRRAILASVTPARPRLLDIGAGTGRIGLPFVQAGDDYVAADVSLGMLREFMRKAHDGRCRTSLLVQANGEQLPFRDRSFDAVMLVQIFGGMRGWRRLIGEARRVLRQSGVLLMGRSLIPPDGIDEQMKRHVQGLLAEMNLSLQGQSTRENVRQRLEATAARSTRIIAATWRANRTPADFLDRRNSGAQFSMLPAAVKSEVLEKLSIWAAKSFGSLDAVFPEIHEFELRAFQFEDVEEG
jgi:ubiquinone/menaquinone biosynthesis C-methylase UbiE